MIGDVYQTFALEKSSVGTRTRDPERFGLRDSERRRPNSMSAAFLVEYGRSVTSPRPVFPGGLKLFRV